MEFSVKLRVHPNKSGWSIVYIEGPQATGKNIFFSFSEDPFVKANSADPHEMLHSTAFHLGLHCLPRYTFRGFILQRVYCIFIPFLDTEFPGLYTVSPPRDCWCVDNKRLVLNTTWRSSQVI